MEDTQEVSGEAVAEAEGVAEATTPEAGEVQPSESDVTTEAQLYTIKVDGQERQVSMDELTSLAQMGDNYTRKSQELAAQRKQLEPVTNLLKGLRSDPQETLRQLAQELGVEDLGATDDLVDPEDARISRLERTIREQQIERDLTNLHAVHGEFDDEGLFAYAIEHEIRDLGTAYRAFAFEQVQELAKADAAAQRQTAETQRTDAKRAAVVVEGGASQRAGATVAGGGRARSIREAFAQAKQQLG